MLKHFEGSYVIKHKESGDVVMEIFKDDPRINHLNTDKFELVPISEYLASLQRTTK